MGCDSGGTTSEEDALDVSIHAPTWGATIEQKYYAGESYVSIPAPTWGATYRL